MDVLRLASLLEELPPERTRLLDNLGRVRREVGPITPELSDALADRMNLRHGDVHEVVSFYSFLQVPVDAVRVFKTDPRVYQLAVDRLGVPASSMCFFSSNAWDAWAASDFGMRVVWCNRYGQPPENLPGHPDAEVRSLDEALPLLLG